MNVVRFGGRRQSGSRKPKVRRGPLSHLGLAAGGFGAAFVLGLVAIRLAAPAGPVPALATVGASEVSTTFAMCGRDRYTCVVDGDTIWLNGRNLRMQGYDTPEPYTAICGGPAEVALAKQASARMLDLLNSAPFSVETFGLDNTGKRTLATIRIGGRDVGDILIDERLARIWPDGDEWWCRPK